MSDINHKEICYVTTHNPIKKLKHIIESQKYGIKKATLEVDHHINNLDGSLESPEYKPTEYFVICSPSTEEYKIKIKETLRAEIKLNL